MALPYDTEAIDKKLDSLKTKSEKLEYLQEYLFGLKKMKAEFVATDNSELQRLLQTTENDFDLLHSLSNAGRLIYWYPDNKLNEMRYKKLGFENIPQLLRRLKLEKDLSEIEGKIILFENLIEREKNKIETESRALQPEIKIGLDSGDFAVDSAFNHLYYEIRYNAWNDYLQAKVKDEFGRILTNHSGYKRTIIERLKFALNYWLIYQNECGNLIKPTDNRVKEVIFRRTKGAEAFYNWLIKEYPKQSTTITETIEPRPDTNPIEIKPTIKPEQVQPLFDIIKDYFSVEDQTELNLILNSGGNASRKLLFKGNGNRLADTFKKMFENKLIAGCEKQDLEQWISNNFQFLKGKEAANFRKDVLNKYISGNNSNCMNPLIEIENGQIQKSKEIRRKKYTNH